MDEEETARTWTGNSSPILSLDVPSLENEILGINSEPMPSAADLYEFLPLSVNMNNDELRGPDEDQDRVFAARRENITKVRRKFDQSLTFDLPNLDRITIGEYEHIFQMSARFLAQNEDQTLLKDLHKIKRENYVLVKGIIKEEMIGQGGFGKVWRMKNAFTNESTRYALKAITLTSRKRDDDKVHQEVEMLKRLSHPGIVKIREDFISTNTMDKFDVSTFSNRKESIVYWLLFLNRKSISLWSCATIVSGTFWHRGRSWIMEKSWHSSSKWSV